jgi:ABC-type lipoprotein release transport system permease subunit
MVAMLRFGLKNLARHRKMALAMSLAVSVAIVIYLTLVGYRTGLVKEYETVYLDTLVVQEADSFGELYGSRLSPAIGDLLMGIGLSQVVPEIHTITGASIQNATLIRGVDLAQYQVVNSFTLISGHALNPSSPSRSAMVGERLAEKLELQVDQVIWLRGRDFHTIGIFRTNTYADQEAWISLADAQVLLGWGQDVSIFIIPDGEALQEGDSLPGGVTVTRRGESSQTITDQLHPILDVLQVVAQAMALATAIALTNVLWRLAWIHRRELAILRSVGFQRHALVGYLLAQATFITSFGTLLGIFGALAINAAFHLGAAGFEIHPHFDIGTILLSLAWMVAITLAGISLPIMWLNRLNLARLLSAE